MEDKQAVMKAVRDFIEGLIVMADRSDKDFIKSFKPSRRRGVCSVERCALAIESPCGSCQAFGCQRCLIAAELRAAKARIHDEREAELADLGFDNEDLEELIDKVVGGICPDHAAFGSELAGQWYNRQNFSQTRYDA
jgi:hypothetical protein